uniref:superoxide dismutase [Cu-Zn] 2-like n=1 Tax=Styela clava TaxID=7725 RepID=UPI00193A57D4|nr:superoxide dismutase [Cu-Zn] 2-like [Styela clava]
MTKVKAICKLDGDKGVKGDILLELQGDGTCKITGIVEGLKAGKHGFHVHEFGDFSQGCISTGGHFNPNLREHAGPADVDRHVGDLGNIIAEENGQAVVDITDSQVTLCGANSVIGRAIVVHADEDDLGRGKFDDSKTTGHAGARLACGVIGITK